MNPTDEVYIIKVKQITIKLNKYGKIDYRNTDTHKSTDTYKIHT